MDFPSTMWTAIQGAKEDPQGSRDKIIKRYWNPILRYARVRGLSPEDAEDVTQNTFIQICKDGFLEQADRTQGRFRALLIAVTKNIINLWLRHQYAEKREGDRRKVSLDGDRLQKVLEDAKTAGVDAQFNRVWAENILEQALVSLKEESERLQTPYHQAVQSHYLEGLSYSEIAAALGIEEDKVKNYVFRGKALLGEGIREEIRQYCGSQAEFDGELQDMQEFLSASS